MKAVIGMLVIITISVVVAIYFLCFESEEQVIQHCTIITLRKKCSDPAGEDEDVHQRLHRHCGGKLQQRLGTSRDPL